MRSLSPHAVWSQTPLATRTITLPAGSYSVRAGSTQQGVISFGVGDTSQSLSISSVTTTRTTLGELGQEGNAAVDRILATKTLTNATTVTANRASSGTATTARATVTELY